MSLDDSEDCGCTGDPERAVDDPQYRRALWIVIILNVGFGMIELAAGFLAASQALKADALDFGGDAATYAISLAVIGMSATVRARAARLMPLILPFVNLMLPLPSSADTISCWLWPAVATAMSKALAP